MTSRYEYDIVHNLMGNWCLKMAGKKQQPLHRRVDQLYFHT